MKKRIWLFIALVAVISLLTFPVLSCGDDNINENKNGDKVIDDSLFAIKSPYAGVNWDTFGQYKAAQHVHTRNSDGSGTMEAVLKIHYDLGYDIIGITDHVWVDLDASKGHPAGAATRPYLNMVSRSVTQTEWPGLPGGMMIPLTHITQERKTEFETGTAAAATQGTYTRPPNKPMLIVPGTAEFALEVGGEEMNVFFFTGNAPGGWTTNLRGGIQVAAACPEAVFFINHPGRTTTAQNFRVTDSRTGVAGVTTDLANPSNMNNWIVKYANLFMEFPSTKLTGLEVFNRRDIDSLHDRVLWDNINSRTIPEGRFVWGYANDDLHSTSIASDLSGNGIHINYNVFVMPENTLANFKSAMIGGQSYMVTVCGYNERINILAATAAALRPSITSITTGKDSITIVAENAEKIVWISNGKTILETIGDSGTINLADAEITDQVGAYVRANIIGEFGMALIQPIGTKKR